VIIDIDRYRIAPGAQVTLRERPTKTNDGVDGDKAAGRRQTAELIARLGDLQQRLYASATHRLLVVLQAQDAAGKDGTIRAVFTGVNPQGTKVTSFKQPSEEELAHDYLWRVHPHVPRDGEIAIFNRSHYEDVLVARVRELVPEARWQKRYGHINAFEQLLADEGTTIVKLFLHISPEEQARRLQERIDDPSKRWKFRRADLDDRALWDAYHRAYETVMERTSTEHAPWYVVPADRNWYRNLVVAQILVATLEALDLRYPDAEPGLDGLKVI
jgi:PPK2 family polyphosphate:nucleotide phosphotransferase